MNPQHEPIFFIDRNLSDEDLITALRGFQFNVISHYEHYTVDTTPNPQTVPDDTIIRDVSNNSWTLITADAKMEYTHFSTIRSCQVSIFIVPDNAKNAMRWAEAMVKGRASIYRCIKNYQFPFVARLNASGSVYQLRCVRQSDKSPSQSAMLIKDGKTDHECARRNRKKAG